MWLKSQAASAKVFWLKYCRAGLFGFFFPSLIHQAFKLNRKNLT